MSSIKRHAREIMDFIDKGDWRRTDDGVLIHDSILMRGSFVSGGELYTANLAMDEGVKQLASVALGQTAKDVKFYLALFSGNVTPEKSWTAVNFPAMASEITSTTEGYSNPTRPEWVRQSEATASPDGGWRISNETPALFNIVCSSVINVSGVALLTDEVRGGTTGKIISASRYPVAQQLSNAAEFTVKYSVDFEA